MTDAPTPEHPRQRLLVALGKARECRKAGQAAEAVGHYLAVLDIGCGIGIHKADEVVRYLLDLREGAEASRILSDPRQLIADDLLKRSFAAEAMAQAGDRDRASFLCAELLREVPARMPIFRHVALLARDLDLDLSPRLERLADELAGATPREALPFVELLKRIGLPGAAERVLDGIAPVAVREEMTTLGLPASVHAAKVGLLRAAGRHEDARRLAVQMVPPPDKLAGLRRPPPDWLRRTASANRVPVPRVVHQVWVGPLPPPDTSKAWRAHCERHGYGYRLWREESLMALGIGQVSHFDRLLAKRDYPGAADIARYFVLREQGGLYFDSDYVPATPDLPLHDSLPMIGAFALSLPEYRSFAGSTWFLSNAVLAAPDHHPIFEAAIENLDAGFAELPHASAWWMPGPGYFTCLTSRGGIHIHSYDIVGSVGNARSLDDAMEGAGEAGRKGSVIAFWKPWRR